MKYVLLISICLLFFPHVRCFVFGHQPPVYGKRGWWSPGESYAKIRHITEDGIGRKHADVYCDCPRCGSRFLLCRTRLPLEKRAASQDAQS